jgi:hypothetical protein
VTANLQLASVATVTGTLTDSSGNPITDGAVTLLQAGAAITNALTNTSGVYTFLILQPGTFDLAASAPEGTFPVVSSLVVNAGATVTQNFQAGSATLTVAVSDPAQPVAGDLVALAAVVDGSPAVLSQATVAADGTASFSQLAAGDYTVFASSSTGDFGQTTVSIAAGGSVTARVALAAQAAVSGTVTDSSAHPLSGATVVFQSTTNLQQGASALTAADGTYTITGLAPGTYDVTVFAAGFVANTRTGVALSPSATAAVNLTLVPSATTISGNLVDPANHPVPAGAVTVLDAHGHIIGQATVGPDGSFQVTTAQGTGLTLQVAAQGYAAPSPTPFTAPAGAATVLDPIVLHAVAIDPAASGPGGAQPQDLFPSDGSPFADMTKEKANAIHTTGAQDTLGPPKCDACKPIYQRYLGAIDAVDKANAKVDNTKKEVNDQADNLTHSVDSDFDQIAGEYRVLYDVTQQAIMSLTNLYNNTNANYVVSRTKFISVSLQNY